MNYRKIGSAGIKISEIAIGGWLTYGGTVTKEKTAPIIKAAIDEGINFIDLADVYSKGKAEEFIGSIIKDYTRSDLVISSKVFWPMSDNVNDRGLSRKHILESVDKSLQRLGLEYLDIYYCHRYDPEVETEEVVRAMDHLVRQGKILYWGTSVWHADHIERAARVAEQLGCYPPTVEQPRYNMIDRHIETDIMVACKRNGIGLTVWSPLAQGLLTGKYNEGIPEKSRGGSTNWLKNDLTETNIEKARKLTEIAKSLDITLSQLALAWILRKKEISCAITGATSPEQLQANVKASEIKLESETLKNIETILDNKPVLSYM